MMSQPITGEMLGEQIGMDLSPLKNAEFMNDFMPAAITGLCDGDVVSPHFPYTDRQAEWYGKVVYNKGRVAQAVAQAAIANGMRPGVMRDFQNYAAEVFALGRDLGMDPGGRSAIRIHGEAVTIDDEAFALARPPEVVVDYGACLTGRSYINDQAAMIDRQSRPFIYMPITRTPFMAEVITTRYEQIYGPGARRAFINKGLYIVRQDGVGTASEVLLESRRLHNQPSETADVILAVHAQHTEADDLKRAVTNAYPLLKQDGMFIIRGMARASEHTEATADDIAGWAFDAGFKERDALRYDKVNVNLGAALVGEEVARHTKTVVLTKR